LILSSFKEILNIERFLRDYREFFESLLRNCKVHFEKVERDYKEKVKIFQGYLDFEQSIKKF
jgi:hypothetical protein